uniref:Phosphoglycerate mutase n=1 Tax=Pyrodinium bahamense TaxID=73915 RepID=A0A7S0FZQ4_9DINO
MAGGSDAARAPPPLPPWPPAPLRHRYFALRHGESEANVAGIIIADPAVGTQRYGLTPAGRAAVAAAAEAFAASALASTGEASHPVALVASDFTRTRETAEVFGETLAGLGKASTLELSEAMRERYFGELEGGPNSRYGEVWAEDSQDPRAEPFGAESAASVWGRTTGLVSRLEAELPNDGRLVVIVSHGDALQILQTAFQGVSPAEHRSLQHLRPAELRELQPSVAPPAQAAG